MQSRANRLLGSILLLTLIIGFVVKVTTVAAAHDSNKSFEQVRVILEPIPSGQAAINDMSRNQVQVRFQAGKGSYFLASENVIVIDANHEPLRAALSFVHEINHANVWHQGKRPDIQFQSKDTYASLRVEEEAEGVVKSIIAKIELAEAGLDVSRLAYPLESVYVEAYEQSRSGASQRERGIPNDELDTISRTAGTEAVIEGFMNGRVLTSNTLESYPNYYGHCWQKAHDIVKLVTPFSSIIMAISGIDLVEASIEVVSGSC